MLIQATFVSLGLLHVAQQAAAAKPGPSLCLSQLQLINLH